MACFTYFLKNEQECIIGFKNSKPDNKHVTLIIQTRLKT